jgi:hypothetical protein
VRAVRKVIVRKVIVPKVVASVLRATVVRVLVAADRTVRIAESIAVASGPKVTVVRVRAATVPVAMTVRGSKPLKSSSKN